MLKVLEPVRRRLAVLCPLILCAATAHAQGPPQAAPPPTPKVERLGKNLFRVGTIRVDTDKREITVPGSVNDVTVLEFIANTKGGMKAYESALTLETDAITFNLALVLIGLERSHGTAPTRHFDPNTPTGDPVEITIERDFGEPLKAERLMFDKKTNQAVSGGGWVYTGSTFIDGNRYLADIEGTLIGFVHSPSPIIEYAPGAGLGSYGSIVLNPGLGLSTGQPVKLVVRALGERTGTAGK